MPLIALSQNELNRLEAIQKIRDRRLSVVQAAEVLNLSRSQVHRLLRAYDQDGASALASKRRSRPSNRRHAEEFRNAVLDLVRDCYRISGRHSQLRSCSNDIRSRSARRRCANG